MWLLSDITNFASEEQVRVKQYVRNGRIVRGYTASRDIEEKDEPQQKIVERRPNPMETGLGVPLALVGIAGLAGIVALAGGKSKGVVEAVEQKVKIEKAVAAAKSPVLSKLPQDLQDLRALYQKDKSAAMSTFYAGINKNNPQEARLKFAQMVSQKEITPEEAAKIVEGYDKATAGGLATGTFKQRVVKQVEYQESKLEDQINKIQDNLEKYTDPDFKGRKPSARSIKVLKDKLEEAKEKKNLVVYDVYGEEFARLGSGKSQMEQKQFLFLQEYLNDDPEQYRLFKNYILGGSILQAKKGKPVGFSTQTGEDAIRSAFEYGYNMDDIEKFKYVRKMNTGLRKIPNIYE